MTPTSRDRRSGRSLLLLRSVWVFLAAIVLALNAVGFPHLYTKYKRMHEQQTKWVVFAMAVAGGEFVGPTAVGNYVPAIDRSGPLGQMIGTTLLEGFILLIPLSIGVAVVRSGLYEIDVIINRTLVYGSQTAALYFGGVAATQALLRTLANQQELPQLVIVASTLAIAALFDSLRRRVQNLIDRSFYRRKYDAAKTLKTFSAKLRDETDLDSLNSDLLSVVRDTMQPEHVSLWLRPEVVSRDE